MTEDDKDLIQSYLHHMMNEKEIIEEMGMPCTTEITESAVRIRGPKAGRQWGTQYLIKLLRDLKPEKKQ